MNNLHELFYATSGRVYRMGSASIAATIGRGLALALVLCGTVSAQTDIEDINRTLAAELVKEGDHDGAAIEYRRLSLMADKPAERDGYRWLSAYYYLEENNADVAVKMLDAVEARGDEPWKVDLLRADAAEQTQSSGEEIFYLNSILDQETLSDDEVDYVARKLATALIRQGQTNRAREVLVQSGVSDQGGLKALDDYMNGNDKNPTVGGWLGVIPGMGYAYGGEYANMVRSIILNGLFIYAMADTAHDEDWGAFSIITFFELTWYTGSIYGGIDSSHRHNIKRKQTLLDAVSGGVIMEPDLGQVPTIQLKFRF